MMRVSGRGADGKAKPFKTDNDGVMQINQTGSNVNTQIVMIKDVVLQPNETWTSEPITPNCYEISVNLRVSLSDVPMAIIIRDVIEGSTGLLRYQRVIAEDNTYNRRMTSDRYKFRTSQFVIVIQNDSKVPVTLNRVDLVKFFMTKGV